MDSWFDKKYYFKKKALDTLQGLYYFLMDLYVNDKIASPALYNTSS